MAFRAQRRETPFPYGDPELDGFVGWWDDLYGPNYLEDHLGPGPNGHDMVTEEHLKVAKTEFKAM